MSLKTAFLCALTLVLVGQSCRRGVNPSKPAKRTEPLQWGMLMMRWDPRDDRVYRDRLKPFASTPNYLMFYYPISWEFPEPWARKFHEIGATTIVSMELWTWGRGQRDDHMSKINAGDYDEHFRKWATGAREFGERVLLRFGFEFNGNWFTWQGDPPAFIAAWRRTHSIFQEVGASNVEWVWCPNVVSVPDTPENDMHQYYPGDKYVDWVGFDGFNFGDDHDEWHRWHSFPGIYTEVLDELERRYPDKPIMIGEFGCAPGEPGQRAQWFRAAYAGLSRRPRVKVAILFGLDKRREGEPDWSLSDDDGSLRAFNDTFARPLSR